LDCKVPQPRIAAGIEDGNDFAIEWVDRAKVGAFAEIAGGAGEREVFAGGFASVLDRDDVFAVKSHGGESFI
jgi:hypothetical protein